MQQRFSAAYAAAVQARINEVEAQAQRAFNFDRVAQAAALAEKRACIQLDQAAQEIVKESRVKMQRTIRKAVGDLLKDRVDAVLLRLFSVKDVQF